MYVCMYVSVCVYVYIHVYVCVCVHVYLLVHVHMYARCLSDVGVPKPMYVCVRMCTYVRARV